MINNEENKKAARYEIIADKIEEMILTDRMGTDSKLPSEQTLATSFGVSRPVIREALMLLNARGLISQKNGEGAYLSQPSGEDFANMVRRVVAMDNTNLSSLFEVRLALETLSVQLAASRATVEDAEKLDALTDEMSRLCDDYSSFAAKDVSFHNLIAQISGNRILEMFVSSLNTQIHAMIEHNLSLKGAYEDALGYHRRITAAIRSGSPETATEVMRSHIIMFMRNAEENKRRFSE